MATRIHATPEDDHLRAGEVPEALSAGHPTAVTSLAPHRLAAAQAPDGAPIYRQLTPVMVNDDTIRALRHAREVVSDLRWRGMTVPPIYASMAEEFQALVRSGAYAAWVATADKIRR
jgi:hypothetical protein